MDLGGVIGAGLGGGTAPEPVGERQALARRAASRLPLIGALMALSPVVTDTNKLPDHIADR